MTKETKDAPPAEPVPGRGAVEEVEAIDVTRYGALMKMRDKALSLAARLEEAEQKLHEAIEERIITDRTYELVLQRAEQAERRLDAARIPEWISVKKQLPIYEIGVWSAPVLVLFNSGAMSVESFIIYSGSGPSWNLAPGVTAKVTHWQPLPAPPGGKS